MFLVSYLHSFLIFLILFCFGAHDLTLNREPQNETLHIFTQDLRHILRVFHVGVLLFTPVLEHAFIL